VSGKLLANPGNKDRLWLCARSVRFRHENYCHFEAEGLLGFGSLVRRCNRRSHGGR
jgi:hypothetical protein